MILHNTIALRTKCPKFPPLQMADIPLDENLASILVAAQYVLGYWSVRRQSWTKTWRDKGNIYREVS